VDGWRNFLPGTADTERTRRAMLHTPTTHFRRKRSDSAALMEKLTCDAVLDRAYAWVCERRKDHGHNACVWDLRFRWSLEKVQLRRDLAGGVYCLSLMSRYVRQSGEEIELWSARDSLVLKALALVLGPVLTIPGSCLHVKGRGGLKGAVRAVRQAVGKNTFVCRTDVRAYYASIGHVKLQSLLADSVRDGRVLSLLWQSMRRCSERGGWIREHTRGIPLGSPLSPLLGAFFLREVDRALEDQRVFYVRYMDDLLVLSPTRRLLREAVKTINRGFAQLDVQKHPGKTFVGRINKGFDFLGYRFGEGPLGLAEKTIDNFLEKCSRLYEQKGHLPRWEVALESYCKRWWRWCTAGLALETSSVPFSTGC